MPESKGGSRSGNYLGKCRRNFYITNRCWDMLHQMSTEIGVSHSAIVELATREMYRRMLGEPAPITYPDPRQPKNF